MYPHPSRSMILGHPREAAAIISTCQDQSALLHAAPVTLTATVANAHPCELFAKSGGAARQSISDGVLAPRRGGDKWPSRVRLPADPEERCPSSPRRSPRLRRVSTTISAVATTSAAAPKAAAQTTRSSTCATEADVARGEASVAAWASSLKRPWLTKPPEVYLRRPSKECGPSRPEATAPCIMSALASAAPSRMCAACAVPQGVGRGTGPSATQCTPTSPNSWEQMAGPAW
mmetsp:Transcript_10152/g.27619  ORF Transcript_10152/g.27619 Transcript_10152/m.27619 type:complete len:232 (-) Transcript_10152:748-1443(-)